MKSLTSSQRLFVVAAIAGALAQALAAAATIMKIAESGDIENLTRTSFTGFSDKPQTTAREYFR